MKNEKGINLIALVMMIIIMTILAAITIIPFSTSYDNAIKAKNEAERKQVLNAITERFGDNQKNSTMYPLVGDEIPAEYLNTQDAAYVYLIDFLKNNGKLFTEEEYYNNTSSNEIRKFVEDNFDDMNYTRILMNTDLLSLDIKTTTSNAVYLVNYYSTDVVGPID